MSQKSSLWAHPLSYRRIYKPLTLGWLALLALTPTPSLSDTENVPTDGAETASPPVAKTRAIKSQSSLSLGADSKRTKMTLPVREELAPETIESIGLRGKASFYGPRFQGRKTASGDIFNNKLFTAASNLIPLGTLVAVKRPDTNLCVVVKVNDRMHPKHRARVIDLSQNAAKYLDMVREGVVKVQIVKVPGNATAGSTIDCTMGYEVFEPEDDCEDCAKDESPLQFKDSEPGQPPK